MYTQVWTKFLPLIRLMTKKSLNGNQVVTMNRTDFDKAGGGRKAGFNFSLELRNGRVTNRPTSPIAKDLATVLQQDDGIMAILSNRNFTMDMNTKCQLTIHAVPAVEAVIETEASTL